MLLAGGDYYDGDDYSLKKLAIFADLAPQSTKKQRRYDLRTTTTGRCRQIGNLSFWASSFQTLDEPRTLTTLTLTETHLRRPGAGDFSSRDRSSRGNFVLG